MALIKVKYIYTLNNNPINEYTLVAKHMRLSVLSLGATITKFVVTNRKKKKESIHLRFHDYKQYLTSDFLCTIYDAKTKKAFIPYMDCQFLEQALCFTYQEGDNYLKILYELQETSLRISCQHNIPEPLGLQITLNLSGNLKHSIEVQEIHRNGDIICQDPVNGVRIRVSSNHLRAIEKRLDLENVLLNKGIVSEDKSGFKLHFDLDNDFEMMIYDESQLA